MGQPTLQEDTITTNTTLTGHAALHAYHDAVHRSRSALAAHPDAFDSDHLRRVEDAKRVINGFFDGRMDLYVNHRENRGNPYTTIKASNIRQWPRGKDKQRDLYGPLQALGVFHVALAKNTNSYLFKLR